MSIERIHNSGVCVLTPDRMFRDHRGVFLETHRASTAGDLMVMAGVEKDFDLKGWNFVQGNVSISQPFVLRGMHFHSRGHQAKLLRCVAGRIYQVSVDVRKGSKTFGQWVAIHLDSITNKAVFVPPGFANGFVALQEGAVVHYELTMEYDEKLDASLAWNDPAVGIQWPFGANASVNMSGKDRAAPRLNEITPWTP